MGFGGKSHFSKWPTTISMVNTYKPHPFYSSQSALTSRILVIRRTSAITVHFVLQRGELFTRCSEKMETGIMAARKRYDECVVVFTLSEKTSLPSFDARYQIQMTPSLKRRISECHYCAVDDCCIKLVNGSAGRCVIVASADQTHNAFFVPRNMTATVLASVQIDSTYVSKSTKPHYVKNSFYNQDFIRIDLLTAEGHPLRKDLLDNDATNIIVLTFL